METFCRRINMQEEVTQKLLAIHGDPAFSPDLAPLTCRETWSTGVEGLQQALGEDPGGFKALCCMLRCAMAAREIYDRLGISEEIYYHTMGCFPRFLEEYREIYGTYGFDKTSWTVRMVSCTLFRIGELEYELVRQEDRPLISIHIPSDARLERPLLRQSWLRARQVLGRAFPEYAEAPMYCHSWLLSPVLKELLPAGSRILTFQSGFDIHPMPNASLSFLRWIAKQPDTSPESIPENTSLQRALKAHLLQGKEFPFGKGFLRRDPYLD